MLTFAWLVLVFSGLGIAFSPQPAFPTIGWTLLTMATVIFLVTMDRWVKALPGILACGVVGGVLTIAAGHTVNHPEVMGSRLDGFAITMLIAISVVLSYRLAKRRLRLLDRVAVFVFALSVFWQVMNSATTVPALTPGTTSSATPKFSVACGADTATSARGHSRLETYRASPGQGLGNASD